jgi:CcmD family protein
MMRFLRACAVAGALLTVMPPASAAALSSGVSDVAIATEQPQPPKGFVPLDEVPPGEQIPAINMVAAAYGFVWLAVLGYVWSIAKRLKQVESELADLESRRK